MRRCWVILLLVCVGMGIGPGGVLAQGPGDACPVIVETALMMTDRLCAETGRNQACYGHVFLEAEPRPDATGFVFDGLGDIVDVAALGHLRLSAMDADAGLWGVALLRVQADLPETLPGQNVTLLLFGDVDLTDAGGASAASATLAVTLASGAVVIDEPSLGGGPVYGPVSAPTTVQADGRTADGLWIHVQSPDGGAGWVIPQMMTAAGDLNALPVVDAATGATGGPEYGPMQAFYFATGMGDAPCLAAPESGLLIQTPQGATEVTLRINEATVRLGSTAYLQAQPGGEMVINLLAGQARVTAFDVMQTVPAGARVRVPLDANLAAAGPPSPPEPYDETALQTLPLGSLPEPVVIAPPLVGGGTAAASLITNGDFALGMTGWTVEQACDHCGMQISADSAPQYGDYLGWQRSSDGREGAAIWARQALNLDVSACTSLLLGFDVRVDGQTLPNSGWWSDQHGGNGEYPAMVGLSFMPAAQGSPFDWAYGFLYQHDGTTSLSNYRLLPRGEWTHLETDILAPGQWVDGFGMALTNPGVLTSVFVGGSGWDFNGGVDNVTLTAVGCTPSPVSR